MRGPFLWALFAWFIASSQPIIGQGSTRETQAEMNAAARADFARADADLNKTYQSVLAKLRDAESKQKLKETQRAWLASRDAEAERAAGEADGGSMAPTIRYETMTHLTRERIKELKTILENGTATPTKRASSSVTPSPASTPESEREQAQSVSETRSSASLTSESVSPDKKWEYRLVDGSRPGIVRAGTSEVVLDLSQFPHPPEASEVLWAPDSKRFALNYQAGTRYQTTDCYQLDGDTWQELDDPECDDTTGPINRSLAAQKKKLKISANKYTRPILISYHVRKWIDANTALLYASREESFAIKNEMESLGASFFFTLKFGAGGNWKIVRTCEVPAKGTTGLNKMEQEELKRIEKEEGEETSTIGDHIYHHQP
jgi:uncharacterized protein YecT (DUF1311 family)